MNKIKIVKRAAIVGCFITNFSIGQGCSDAGFCSMSSLKPGSTDSAQVLKNQCKIGAFIGKADNSILVYGNYLEWNRQLSKNLELDTKLTTISQNGNGISTFEISDIFIHANYKANHSVQLIVGAKIPLSDASKELKNLPLPMDYQASLGTFDLILGVGYEYKKIQFAAAIQQPLTQNNNQFIARNYPLNSALRKFESTNKFERSGDVLLRVSFPVNITPRLKLIPGILPIYHLTNDKYTDEFNSKQEIKGSQGLTLNGNIYLDYKINLKNVIQLNVAMPFIVRASRPDGLTRSFIANIEYSINF